jgi:hypothetical protein
MDPVQSGVVVRAALGQWRNQKDPCHVHYPQANEAAASCMDVDCGRISHQRCWWQAIYATAKTVDGVDCGGLGIGANFRAIQHVP